MASNKGANWFNFKNLLAKPLTKDDVWNDLAEVCNKVLGREVEERRRRLLATRDSQINRRGDLLSQIQYLPESDKPAIYIDTGLPFTDIKIGDIIPKAIITRVVNNGNAYNQVDGVDYFQVEFSTKSGRMVQWLLPTTAPQERSQLLKNNYALGFDFFNSNLSTKDYQRLYDYLNMFFNENGIEDNFIKFIGFIKNMRLDLLPLWSFDDGTDYLNILKADSQTMVHASQGGPWFLTSHVEIRFDLKNQIYGVDTTEIEELFYLFAPIMLVLERIVGYLDAPLQVVTGIVGQVEVTNYGIKSYDYNQYVQIPVALVGQLVAINYGVFDLAFEESLNVIINLRSYAACQNSVVLHGIFEDYSDWEFYGLLNPLYVAVDQTYPYILGYEQFAKVINIGSLSTTIEQVLSIYAQDFTKIS